MGWSQRVKLSWQCILHVCPVQFAVNGLFHSLQWMVRYSELVCSQTENNFMFEQCKIHIDSLYYIAAQSFSVHWLVRHLTYCYKMMYSHEKKLRVENLRWMWFMRSLSILLQSGVFFPLDYKRKMISGSMCCTCLILRWQQLRCGGEQKGEEGLRGWGMW